MKNTSGHLSKLGPLVRLDLFTDAIFAIVITLIAIDLRLERGVSEHDLASEIHKMIPLFTAHLISFTVLAIEWMDHHAMFEGVEECRPSIIIANLIFCFTLTMVPFLTGLLGPFPDSSPAVCAYSLGILGMTAGKELLWQVIRKQHAEGSRRGPIGYLPAFMTSLVSAGLALVHPRLGVAVWIVFGIWSIVSRLGKHKRQATEMTDEGNRAGDLQEEGIARDTAVTSDRA